MFTFRAFTGEYYNHKGDGIYKCVVCGEDLFDSSHKYESGCGWPSFYDNLDPSKVKKIRDTSHGMLRTEVVCAKVGYNLLRNPSTFLGKELEFIALKLFCHATFKPGAD